MQTIILLCLNRPHTAEPVGLLPSESAISQTPCSGCNPEDLFYAPLLLGGRPSSLSSLDDNLSRRTISPARNLGWRTFSASQVINIKWILASQLTY